MSQKNKLILEEDAKKAISLFMLPDHCVEARLLGAVLPGSYRPAVVHGFFDSVDSLIIELRKPVRWDGAYLTLNPVDSALMARANNRLKVAGTGGGTSDKDVRRLKWILIDLDPVRPAGISSTDQEKLRAWVKLILIREHLDRKLGVAAHVVADSGNGFHLLYQIDLPPSEARLVKGVLEETANCFDDAFVKVDRKVFNPSRITKLYGTLAAKGDSTLTRPHRFSRILEIQGVAND